MNRTSSLRPGVLMRPGERSIRNITHADLMEAENRRKTQQQSTIKYGISKQSSPQKTPSKPRERKTLNRASLPNNPAPQVLQKGGESDERVITLQDNVTDLRKMVNELESELQILKVARSEDNEHKKSDVYTFSEESDTQNQVIDPFDKDSSRTTILCDVLDGNACCSLDIQKQGEIIILIRLRDHSSSFTLGGNFHNSLGAPRSVEDRFLTSLTFTGDCEFSEITLYCIDDFFLIRGYAGVIREIDRCFSDDLYWDVSD